MPNPDGQSWAAPSSDGTASRLAGVRWAPPWGQGILARLAGLIYVGGQAELPEDAMDDTFCLIDGIPQGGLIGPQGPKGDPGPEWQPFAYPVENAITATFNPNLGRLAAAVFFIAADGTPIGVNWSQTATGIVTVNFGTPRTGTLYVV